MKHLTVLLAAAASLALIAPAASAKTGVRQAERMCVAAAKAVDTVKSVRASDDERVFTNDAASIPLRITHEDGSRTRMTCSVDRNAGEITALDKIEE